MQFDGFSYSAGHFYDELIDADGSPRPHAAKLVEYFGAMNPKELVARQRAVDKTIVDMGISFTIYSEGDNIDRAWPLDIIPRAISSTEWDRTEAGLMQRLRALNLFIDDLYNDRKIIKDKVVPAELIDSSRNYLKACIGHSPRHGVWANICGSDLVRLHAGKSQRDQARDPVAVSEPSREARERIPYGAFRDA